MQFTNDGLRFDLLLRTVVTKWLRSLPGANAFPPRFTHVDRLLDFFVTTPASQREKLLERLLRISGERKRRRDVFPDVCRIDIDVNHARMRRERRQLAGDTIVESHTERDEQIAFGHRHV